MDQKDDANMQFLILCMIEILQAGFCHTVRKLGAVGWPKYYKITLNWFRRDFNVDWPSPFMSSALVWVDPPKLRNCKETASKAISFKNNILLYMPL